MNKMINFMAIDSKEGAKNSPIPSWVITVLLVLLMSLALPSVIPKQEAAYADSVNTAVTINPKSLLLSNTNQHYSMLEFYSGWHPWQSVISTISMSIDENGYITNIQYDETEMRFEFSGVARNLKVVTDLIFELGAFDFLVEPNPYQTEKKAGLTSYKFAIRYRVNPLTTRLSRN